jgi:hypothetical protein
MRGKHPRNSNLLAPQLRFLRRLGRLAAPSFMLFPHDP